LTSTKKPDYIDNYGINNYRSAGFIEFVMEPI